MNHAVQIFPKQLKQISTCEKEDLFFSSHGYTKNTWPEKVLLECEEYSQKAIISLRKKASFENIKAITMTFNYSMKTF